MTLEFLTKCNNTNIKNTNLIAFQREQWLDILLYYHPLAEYNRTIFVRLMILSNKEGIENNIRNMLMGP